VSGLYENAESASQRLLNAIVFGLKQIKQSSGYDNTVKKVFTEIPTPADIVEHPSIVVLMGDELTDWDDTEALANVLPVTFICFLNAATDPTGARLSLKKDIQKRMGVSWMVPGEDGPVVARLIRPASYKPFGMFLNVPKVGFALGGIVNYSQDVNDPTVST
jgi:hypothetical protein